VAQNTEFSAARKRGIISRLALCRGLFMSSVVKVGGGYWKNRRGGGVESHYGRSMAWRLRIRSCCKASRRQWHPSPYVELERFYQYYFAFNVSSKRSSPSRNCAEGDIRTCKWQVSLKGLGKVSMECLGSEDCRRN
jgi:hypothetical protein